MIDERLILYLIWGVGVVVVFSVALGRRILSWRKHGNDRRALVRRGVRRDVMTAAALWFVSFGASLSIFLVLFGEAGSTPRSFTLALALGMFFGAGLIMATEGGDEWGGTEDG